MPRNTTRRPPLFSEADVLLSQSTNSPYWIAVFKGADGRRKSRSTKVPIKGGWYGATRLTAKQARDKAWLAALEIVGRDQQKKEAACDRTAREVCELMLAGKLGRVSAATYMNASVDYKQFLGWLGKRADEPIRLITRADMKDWIIARRSQVRAKTVHKALTAIRAAFEWAVDAEIIERNPCDKLKVSPDTKEEKVVHEAFTLEELKALLEGLPEEWAAAVRLCLGTYGQRLGDVRALRWEQFDWENRVVKIVTGKTGRALKQPMMPSFFAWARERYEKSQQEGGDAAVYVLPSLRLHSNPSAEFTRLVSALGIGTARKNGAGRRRTWHSKTFHSLRATVATMLQAAGVSQGLAMELVGHESSAVHAVYIRPSAAQLATAASMLPFY